MSRRIAIIGYAARLPGGEGTDELDRFLMSGRTAVTEHRRATLLDHGVPREEIDAPGYIPCSSATGWTVETAEHLGVLSARERRVTDPQQLLFFDCCVGALEHAGIPLPSVAGRDAACVGGIGMGLYAGNELSNHFTGKLRHDRRLLDEAVSPEILVGNASDHTVGRASYRLGLTGPSVNVQTACSTALASIEYACTLLRAGRVELALAGAAALPFPAVRGYRYENGGILSPDGVCRAFDAKATGTVGGGGGGVFVLRRLDDAVRDGDTVHGVIEGIYQGSDGKARPSYTAPAYDGQARVIRGALRDAGLSPADLSYVEGHGTGTPLGDAVELSVLNDVFGERGEPLPVGSTKPALGHLDTAAAVASLVNVLLGLRRGSMPGTVNFTELAPSLSDGAPQPSAVPVELAPVADDGRVRVGLSSFGASGTSVHAIVSGHAHVGRAQGGVPTAARRTGVGTHGAGGAVDTPGAAAGGAPRAEGRTGPPTEHEIVGELIGLIADRAEDESLSGDEIAAIGPADLGLSSVDLLAVAKVIETRWGVAFDAMDMLSFASVGEIAETIIEQADSA